MDIKTPKTHRIIASIALVLCLGLNLPFANAAHPDPQASAPAAPDAVTAEMVASAWKFDQSDLPVDPDVLYGLLPNGMRYAIRRNTTPKSTAVMRLIIDSGSVAEEDDERGLAHFIEHMAFNGTTNVTEGEMVRILERLGLEFGADTNAYTGVDETGYTLDLPNVREETIDTSLFLLRETASEITFDPEAIDRERGVILSEMRTRQNYAQRDQDSLYGFTLPDTRYATHNPIGERAVIETAPAERFRSFYERFYTPGRSTLIVVGDIDPAQIEAKIVERFSNWIAKQGEQPQTDTGSIAMNRPSQANIFVHPAIGEVATVMQFAPYEKRPDTYEIRRENLMRALAYNIIQRRLGTAARLPEPPFIGANAGRNDAFELANRSIIRVATKDGEWQTGLAAAERELRSALEFGFTQEEVDEQLANATTGFENSVRSAQTRRNDGLADQLVYSASEGVVVTTPASQLARFTEMRNRITPQSLLDVLRKDFIDLDQPLIHLSTKTPVKGGEQAVLAAYQKSRQIATAPPEVREAIVFAYDDFGPAGAVVADSRIEDLNIRTLVFANNVRLNLKKTDFEDDRVRISLRVDGGNLLATRENPEATSLMNIFVRGGLEKHSLDDLYSVLAGSSVSLNYGSGEDYLGSYVTTTPQDLALQMEVLAAFTIHPGYRPEAVTQYRNYLPGFFARLNATPESTISSQLGAILSDKDPRFSLADESVFAALDFDQLRAAVGDRLQNGAIEIGMVGDFDEDEAIATVARTFGALPMREAEFRPYNESRDRHFTGDRSVRTLYHQGETDQAVVEFYWPTTDNSDFDTDIRLRLLAELLQLKVTDEIRENLGVSYSPNASSFTSSDYPGYGYIRISVNVDSHDVELVSTAIKRIAAQLSEPIEETDTAAQDRAISPDEISRAKTPILEKLEINLRENSAWLSIVDEAQSDPEMLQRFRDSGGAFSKVATSELLALARQYLAPEKALVVNALHDRFQNAPNVMATD